MNGPIEIELTGLCISLVFILLAGISSVILKLKLERDLLWGTIRTVSQLVLIGFVLRYVFQIQHPVPILLLYTLMIYFAARIIYKRVDEHEVSFFTPTFLSMLLSYVVVTTVVVGVIVRAEPWYLPQYYLPLGGMIIGNSMNAIAIALERLFSDMRVRFDEVELALTFGVDYKRASESILRSAIRAGMIPSINAMMGVGIVFLPGMMSGQILAGADPVTAVQYQIVVMLMLVGSTTIGSILVVYFARKRCFDAEHRLIISKSKVKGKHQR
ncbi:MAG: iron export ABC transporter permease subunit FetB [Chlorobi bacterium]|nr:iron export ABC transporter permease subunit FetB [Chlorobiota bacterium]